MKERHHPIEVTLMTACALCLLIISHNQMAWIFVGLSYFLMWKGAEKKCALIMGIMLISLTFHHIIAYVVSHQLFTLPIHDLDHRGHHLNAIIPARRLPPNWGDLFFQRSIEGLYWISPSWFLASEYIILLFTLAMVGFYQLLHQLKLQKKPMIVLIALLGFMPQILIWTSIPLKENLELCGFVWILFTTLLLIENQMSHLKGLLLLAGMMICMIFFHKATAAMVIAMLILWVGCFGPWSKRSKVIYATSLICLGTLIATTPLLHTKAPIESMREYIINFHEISRDLIGNTNYPAHVQFYPQSSSLLVFFMHTLKQYGYYLFGPFPNEWIQQGQLSYKMLLLSGYAWLRGLLILNILIFTPQMNTLNKKRISLFASSYLIITGIFSLGSFNYAQALRHHLQTDWILWILTALVWYNHPLKNTGKTNGRLRSLAGYFTH